MNKLRQAFIEALVKHKMTQSDFARLSLVTPTAITKFLRGSVPRKDLFKAVFSIWPDRETGINLMRAHLSDELDRAGFDPSLLSDALARIDSDIHSDLAVLDAAVRNEPSLRRFIRKTAGLFRAEYGSAAKKSSQ